MELIIDATLTLNQDDLDEIIALCDGGAANLGGNAQWCWPDTALGRTVTFLMGRAPTRIEVVAAMRRVEDRIPVVLADAGTQAHTGFPPARE